MIALSSSSIVRLWNCTSFETKRKSFCSFHTFLWHFLYSICHLLLLSDVETNVENLHILVFSVSLGLRQPKILFSFDCFGFGFFFFHLRFFSFFVLCHDDDKHVLSIINGNKNKRPFSSIWPKCAQLKKKSFYRPKTNRSKTIQNWKLMIPVRDFFIACDDMHYDALTQEKPNEERKLSQYNMKRLIKYATSNRRNEKNRKKFSEKSETLTSMSTLARKQDNECANDDNLNFGRHSLLLLFSHFNFYIFFFVD